MEIVFPVFLDEADGGGVLWVRGGAKNAGWLMQHEVDGGALL